MLDTLKPRKFLSLGRYDLPHVGDISKPYFVTVGCSYSAGTALDYKDVWCNVLAKKLKLQHVNLSFPGSSLEYQHDKIVESEKILSDAKFIVWMQTHPVRSHRKFLSYFIGDRNARILFDLTDDDVKTWHKIQKMYELVKHKKILITNSWHWNNKTKLLVENKICKKNKNYFFNKHEKIDVACDNLHAGPKSHLVLANELTAHILKHFPNWVKEITT
jgi:hypothetical protein